LVAAKGLVVDTGSLRELCTRLFWDAVQLWNTLKRRAEGDYSPDPHLATLPEWELSKAGKATAGPTFDDLIEGWALDTHPTKTVKTNFSRHLRFLSEHLGHDDAANVERKDIIAFKEAELRAGKAPKTVSTELGGVGAVFSWAFKNEKIPVNPATKIEVAALKAARRRGEKPRFPYATQEAVTILTIARRETNPDRLSKRINPRASSRLSWAIAEEVIPGEACQTDEQLIEEIRERGVSNLHPVGTCRMGREVDAVVDPRLRVHGIEGLRVADASIMPQVPGGNTNAPSIMIGEKCAAMMLEDAEEA
jgi:choline dehydrogenase-like flavoprotein